MNDAALDSQTAALRMAHAAVALGLRPLEHTEAPAVTNVPRGASDFLADLHDRVQPARFAEYPQMVQLIPIPETSDSGWGDLLAEPLLDMLTTEVA